MPELFEKYIYSENCHFKYARGKPAAKGREFHSYDEIVLFLEGRSQLISEKTILDLSPGSVVFIPKETFHQFRVADENEYLRCILGFEETEDMSKLLRGVMNEVTVFPRPSAATRAIFDNLMKACENKLGADEKGMLVRAAVIHLLAEQKMTAEKTIEKYRGVSSVTEKAISYISANLSEDIKLSEIARAQSISVSSLSHSFRRDLNISVYRYITEKRMSMVRRYLGKGVDLTEAARLSGFRDYSGFFRLYKKRYGECPSKTKSGKA